MNDLFTVALRATVVYIFIILAIRLFGKKELSQLSVIDLVFILLISNAVQNAMVGNNTSLPAGIIAATSLFIINYLFKFLLFRSKKLSGLIQGNPLMLIYKGKVIKEHLNQAKIADAELTEAVREHGVQNVADVDLAILEVDGNISVLSENYRKRTVKKRAHKMLTKMS
ncbi:MAG TPA: YetF domain-containing protein [Patescibacteria group bacterium]|jgi:uncharacterized membrane protein YcaP (DUF421 family)|nr:YetF domain-containing protein [Patescibacteria group bacterium]